MTKPSFTKGTNACVEWLIENGGANNCSKCVYARASSDEKCIGEQNGYKVKYCREGMLTYFRIGAAQPIIKMQPTVWHVVRGVNKGTVSWRVRSCTWKSYLSRLFYHGDDGMYFASEQDANVKKDELNAALALK